MIHETKEELESKISRVEKYRERISKTESQTNKLEDMILAAKRELFEEMKEQKVHFANSCVEVDEKSKKVELKVLDVKFWLEDSQKQLQRLDSAFDKLRDRVISDFETV